MHLLLPLDGFHCWWALRPRGHSQSISHILIGPGTINRMYGFKLSIQNRQEIPEVSKAFPSKEFL